MKERLLYIDCLKGFLILLVVLGHVLQKMYSPENFDQNLLFRLIYSFHMPLFFMVSGFVTKLNSISFDGLKKKTIKRFKQLIIPFCVWGIIWHFTFNETTLWGFFREPDCSLWFLWDLFWITLVFNLALYFGSLLKRVSTVVWILCGFILLKGLSYFWGSSFGLRGISDYYLYFFIGVLLGEFKSSIFKKNRLTPILTGFLFVMFGAFAINWYRIPQSIPDTIPSFVYTINSLSIYRFGTTLLGCLSFIYLFFLVDFRRFEKGLLFLGIRTLPIYAIHQTVIWLLLKYSHISIGFWSTIPGFLIAFVLVLLISLLIMYVLKQNRYVSLAFLGSE